MSIQGTKEPTPSANHQTFLRSWSQVWGELGGGQEQSAGASVFPFCREWVLKSSILIAMAVYTYLRLIVDHHGTAQLQALRQKEVDFCISLLRERVRTTQYGE